MTPSGLRSRELAAVGAFCGLNLVLSFALVEAYPFSLNPLFTDSAREVWYYAAWTPEGEPIPPDRLSIHLVYESRFEQHAVRSPPTVNRYGIPSSRPAVEEAVRRALERYPALPYVTVRRQKIGAVDGARVGVVESEQWIVNNSAFRTDAPADRREDLLAPTRFSNRERNPRINPFSK